MSGPHIAMGFVLGLVVLIVLSLTVLSAAGIVLGMGILLVALSFAPISVRWSLGFFLAGIAMIIGPFFFL